jgi:hypothetical protein
MAKPFSLFLVLAALLVLGLWFALRGAGPSSTLEPHGAPSGPAGPRSTAPPEASERETREPTAAVVEPAPVVPTAEVQAPTAVVFWARVVRDEDGVPLPFVQAEYARIEGEGPSVQRTPLKTDAEGLVEIRGFAEHEGALLVDLADFAQAAAPIVPGHGTREKAFVLRLARAAALRVSVRGPSGAARPGVVVRASARDHELSQSDFWFDDAQHVRSEFVTATDGQGFALLGGLPPTVELELSVSEGGKLLMRDPRRWSLDPGETREVTLAVGGTATLAGRAIDQNGAAVPDQELWLVKPDPTMGLVFREWTTPTQRVRTDVEGRFEFADVAEGEWWIGPARESQGPVATPLPPPAAEQALAAIAERVVLAPGAGRVEIVLRLVRGLYLRGFVRERSGAAAPLCSVSASPTDRARFGFLGATSDADGAFRIGPVLDVEYELTAGGAFQGEFAQSPSVRARGGASDLVLVVSRAAILRGVVIDPDTNEPCDAQVFLSQADVHDGFAMGLGTQGNKSGFEVTGITPGVWDVVVTGRNALLGTTRVSLAEAEVKEVLLRLSPSVVLTFKNTSPTEFFYLFPQCDGLALQSEGIDPGKEQRLTLPPGRITVRVADAQAKTLGTRTVDIAPGAAATLEYP